ncbi:MAG: hypothetical protein EA415_04380 [Sphaerobacteraceae bacterium]|nr:MAG: hypothetical protein EA415_04380 [Sphaerobacteraceae bacterium]
MEGARLRSAGRGNLEAKRFIPKTFSLSQYWERVGVRTVVTDGAKVTAKLHHVSSRPLRHPELVEGSLTLNA